jgi:hypothetical protein
MADKRLGWSDSIINKNIRNRIRTLFPVYGTRSPVYGTAFSIYGQGIYTLPHG